MASFGGRPVRTGASIEVRLLDDAQPLDGSCDYAEDDDAGVDDDERVEDKHDVDDDEEAPLTSSRYKNHYSGRHADFFKSPSKRAKNPQLDSRAVDHGRFDVDTYRCSINSRKKDMPAASGGHHLEDAQGPNDRTSEIVVSTSPPRALIVGLQEDRHHGNALRNGTPVPKAPPTSSRADNRETSSAVTTELSPFHREEVPPSFLISGRSPAEGNEFQKTVVCNDVVRPWSLTGSDDLDGLRKVNDSITDTKSCSNDGTSADKKVLYNGTCPSDTALGSTLKNYNQQFSNYVDPRSTNNHATASSGARDHSSPYGVNDDVHGAPIGPAHGGHSQNGLGNKTNRIVVDRRHNLVDKRDMRDSVTLESYASLDDHHKNDHSISGYLDANKNGPTKEKMEIDVDDKRKLGVSNGSLVAGGSEKGEEEDDDGGPCGWGRFQLDFCQRFRNPLWFLVVLTLCGACQGMAVNGFVNTVISTIEKRYEITSTESGLIASCYDIVFVLLVIPVSYFGGHGHKPRYLGIGILILGIGSFVFSLPHFISGSYVVENAEDTVCKVNSNTTSHQCASTAASSLSNYKYFFFLGQGLHGAGATALYTLGVTYIDENVPQRVSSFYNGIFYTGAIIGPAIGYMVGAEFLNIYTEITVDPTTLGLDTSNPKWVGAWWIGFLISGVFGVLLSLPLLAYPSALPGSKKYAAERGKEAQAMKSKDETGKNLGIKDCLLSIKLLLTNIPFMFINLAAAADGVLVAGFSTFMPKFIEYQFGVPAGTAALYVGLAVVPAGGGATFAGGFIVRLFNLKVRGILRLCTIMSFVLFGLAFSLLMECDTGPFAGVTLAYGQRDVSNTMFMGKELNNSCNHGCGCEEEDYFPMCGRDNVMYFSPCYAGCSGSRHDGDSKMYYNCSCVNYNLTDKDWASGKTHMGVFGKCEYKCKWLTVFMILFTFMIVFVFITSMPSLTATLRCVPDHQRSFGLGIQWIVARCLGSIPGPILFGKMFDLACLVWQKRCDGEGSCFFYDNHNMSINLMVLALVFSLIAALTFLIALCFYKVQDEDVTVAVKGGSEKVKAKNDISLQVLSSGDIGAGDSVVSVGCDSAGGVSTNGPEADSR